MAVGDVTCLMPAFERELCVLHLTLQPQIDLIEQVKTGTVREAQR
jgi:hypothetical protein